MSKNFLFLSQRFSSHGLKPLDDFLFQFLFYVGLLSAYSLMLVAVSWYFSPATPSVSQPGKDPCCWCQALPLPVFSYLTLEREPGSNQCHVFFPTATFPSLHPTSRVDEISAKKVTFDKKTRRQWTSEWSLKTFLFSPIQFIYRQCWQPFCCYDRCISAHHRQRQSPTAAFKHAMPLLAASW